MAPILVPFSQPLAKGRLVRRYKRFFVDVVLDDGTPIVAHTANTGAMTGLIQQDAPVLLTRHEGKKRVLPYELEAVHVDEGWVSVNTGTANLFAARAVTEGLIPELCGYQRLRREVSPHPRSHSRFDLCLEDLARHAPSPQEGPAPVSLCPASRCFVEVKSVTLKSGQRALFPDAVTERGRKHLDALARLARRGQRAAMLYIAKRDGCSVFAPAVHIDPAYARSLRRAVKAGVEVFCASCSVDDRGLSWGGRLAVELS